MSGRSYEVLLGQDSVGWLSERDDGHVGFRFNDSYRIATQRLVLSQSFEDDLARVSWGKQPGELPPFFANLLPEGRFRDVLESSLAVTPGDDLGLLVAVGSDLPGAVVLRPSVNVYPPEPTADLRNENGLNGEGSTAMRFSLAGVQLKFSMLSRGGKLTLTSHGERGDWIVKVSTPDYPGLAENEYSMLEWARASGFDVPQSELHAGADIPALGRYIDPGTSVLAVQRYDRQQGLRVHQEDFMQVFGWRQVPLQRKYSATYEQLVSVIRGLLGEAGALETIRRLVFIAVSGNADAHLKNWSILYRDGITPELTPLYDQVSTVAWKQLDRELALKFGGSREFGRVSVDSFARLARKLSVDPKLVTITVEETLNALGQAWKQISARLPLPRPHLEALLDHWHHLPLVRQSEYFNTL